MQLVHATSHSCQKLLFSKKKGSHRDQTLVPATQTGLSYKDKLGYLSLYMNSLQEMSDQPKIFTKPFTSGFASCALSPLVQTLFLKNFAIPLL